MSLAKHVLISIAKSVLIKFGLPVAMAATDAAIQKKVYVSGTTALIIWKEEIVKSL